MFRIPVWVLLKAQHDGNLDEILQYRLDATDVARMLRVSQRSVQLWTTTRGFKGVMLGYRRYVARGKFAYSLRDVEKFVELVNIVGESRRRPVEFLEIDYNAVPEQLREWKTLRVDTSAKPATFDATETEGGPDDEPTDPAR